ncbi:MAG TPA: V-type ATP synthase subunit C [Methanoculleus sp.]|nr:V-type ATP synthase subunit C [Methanoculleus sp.]
MYIEYVNARVRGMKRHLMDREFFERLMKKPDIDAIITELEKTSYHDGIEKASIQSSGLALIDQALRHHLVQTYRLLLSLVMNEQFERHVRIFLEKWDIQNIKTIMRGKNINAPADEILACLVPAGQLDEVTLLELVRQPDVRGVIDLLATWGSDYARPLTERFGKYAEKKDLAILEYALDRFYYERALRLLGGRSVDDRKARDLLTTEIDVVNIKSILRLIRDGVKPEDGKNVLIEGGKALDMPALLDLLNSGSIRAARSALRDTPYSFLSALPEKKAGNETISEYEKELDRYIIDQGIQMFKGDPLSIAGAIAYIVAKNNEIANIRIISHCKGAYLPEEEIREEVLYV